MSDELPADAKRAAFVKFDRVMRSMDREQLVLFRAVCDEAKKARAGNAELTRRVVALEAVGRQLLEACSLLLFARNDPDYPDCVDAAQEAMRAAKDAGL